MVIVTQRGDEYDDLLSGSPNRAGQPVIVYKTVDVRRNLTKLNRIELYYRNPLSPNILPKQQ